MRSDIIQQLYGSIVVLCTLIIFSLNPSLQTLFSSFLCNSGSHSGPSSEKQSPMTQKHSPQTQPSPSAQPGQGVTQPGQTPAQPGQPPAQTSQTVTGPPAPAASQSAPAGSQQSPVSQPSGLPPQLYLHDGRYSCTEVFGLSRSTVCLCLCQSFTFG